MLEQKGYQVFAPFHLSPKKWSDRTKTLEEPLFPGYVFVRTSGTNAQGLVCSTPGVVRILSFGGRPSLVPSSELDAIQKIAVLRNPLPTQYLCVGQRVEVKDGPFAGIVGIIRKIKNRACLVVSVHLISQSIYVDVDEFQIAPVISTSLAAECV